MDISQIAALLAPLVPYLVKGGIELAKSAAGKLGEKITEESWEGLEAWWKKIRKKGEKKPAFQDAIQKAEARPEDERVHKAIELQLEDLLTENPELEKEARTIVGQIVNLSHSERSVVVGGDVKDSVIVTGDGNRVVKADTL